MQLDFLVHTRISCSRAVFFVWSNRRGIAAKPDITSSAPSGNLIFRASATTRNPVRTLCASLCELRGCRLAVVHSSPSLHLDVTSSRDNADLRTRPRHLLQNLRTLRVTILTVIIVICGTVCSWILGGSDQILCGREYICQKGRRRMGCCGW